MPSRNSKQSATTTTINVCFGLSSHNAVHLFSLPSTVLVNWESLKRQFKGAETFRNKEQITFPLPTALYNLMSDEYMEALEEQQGGIADEVFLKFEDMQAFFDPVVNKGLGLIEEQLAKCPNGQCNKLFVVGGFSVGDQSLHCNNGSSLISQPI